MTAQQPGAASQPLSETLRSGWQPLAPWRLKQVRAEGDQARLLFDRPDGAEVQFRLSALAAASRRGPFDLEELAIAYLKGPVDFAVLEPLGKALQQRLRGHNSMDVLRILQTAQARPVHGEIWPITAPAERLAGLVELLDPRVVAGLSRSQWPEDQAAKVRQHGLTAVDQPPSQGEPLQGPEFVPPDFPQLQEALSPSQPAGPAGDWPDRARAALVDRPGISVRLVDLLGADALPPWRCALPWTRLELSQGGFVGPCCVEYQAERFAAEGSATSQWNGKAMQRFRAEMAKPGLPAPCRATCPVWQGRSEPVGEVRISGGPQAAVDSQIRTVQALLAGAVHSQGAPLAVCLTATSFCNYDCLMCPLGEEGQLSDQLTPAFYAELLPMLQGVQVLEVNGGEPMASPHFRSFLEQLDRHSLPQLRVNLITNGSYLTAQQWQRLLSVPWGNLTWSLNAATAETYQLVNRGLPFERIRANLDALNELRRAGEVEAQVTYSMVVLKQNLHEIELLGELAARDGASVRLMLPFRNRHNASIMTDRAAMESALKSMQKLASQLVERGRGREARGVLAQARVLWERLDRGWLAAL